MHRRFACHLGRKTLAAAAVVLLSLTFGAAAGASPTDASQTPTGSNGVNHNDPAPPPNPDCTDSAGTSGTCSQPQPPSNADQNNTGANDTGSGNAYASTRNGADSDNGSRNGNATGEPCAGCVGRADNKNPMGQAPDGPTDHNNGYECDGNNGIGQTNPAHTGCTASATSGTSTNETSTSNDTSTNGTSTSNETGNECVTAGSCTEHSTSGTQSFCNAATSQCSPGAPATETGNASTPMPPAEVLGESITSTPGATGPAAFAVQPSPTVTGGASVLGETVARSPQASGALARTGGNASGLAVDGIVLLIGGAALELLVRRRRTA